MGLVDLRIDNELLFLRLPKPAFKTAADSQLRNAAAALGIDVNAIERAAIIDVGVAWFTLQLRDAEAVSSLKPDFAAIAALPGSALSGLNVFGFYKDGGPADIEVRSFAPAHGIPEDPVCGSGNGCVAAFIQRDDLLERKTYVSSQGRCLGRDGRVEIRFEDESIWLGGNSVTCVEGTLQVQP